ncbi:MAG: hypothetical protein HGB02_03785 [Chlorobiaceae bacterium]|nr:hypothetical protein [Chlorobiaceae bacterium]
MSDTPTRQPGKDVKDMNIDEMRKEIYRLQHKITGLGNAIKAKQAIIDHMRDADSKRQAQHIVDAIERMFPLGAMRRL